MVHWWFPRQFDNNIYPSDMDWEILKLPSLFNYFAFMRVFVKLATIRNICTKNLFAQTNLLILCYLQNASLYTDLLNNWISFCILSKSLSIRLTFLTFWQFHLKKMLSIISHSEFSCLILSSSVQ